MKKIYVLFDFERTLGIFTYNGRYLTGIKLRNLFWEIYDSLKTESNLNLKLLIHIPRLTFLKLWPQAEDYFQEILYIPHREMIYDIPGHSPHYFINGDEFETDLIVSSKANLMKKYAQHLTTIYPVEYFQVTPYFPEMLSTGNKVEQRIFGIAEIDQFIQEVQELEKQSCLELYLTIKTKLENSIGP